MNQSLVSTFFPDYYWQIDYWVEQGEAVIPVANPILLFAKRMDYMLSTGVTNVTTLYAKRFDYSLITSVSDNTTLTAKRMDYNLTTTVDYD